jgi:hypothetical protein
VSLAFSRHLAPSLHILALTTGVVEPG